MHLNYSKGVKADCWCAAGIHPGRSVVRIRPRPQNYNHSYNILGIIKKQGLI